MTPSRNLWGERKPANQCYALSQGWTKWGFLSACPNEMHCLGFSHGIRASYCVFPSPSPAGPSGPAQPHTFHGLRGWNCTSCAAHPVLLPWQEHPKAAAGMSFRSTTSISTQGATSPRPRSRTGPFAKIMQMSQKPLKPALKVKQNGINCQTCRALECYWSQQQHLKYSAHLKNPSVTWWIFFSLRGNVALM